MGCSSEKSHAKWKRAVQGPKEVGGEGEDLFIPGNPVWSGLGRGTAWSHRPAQSLVPGMAGLPAVLGPVVERPPSDPRFARLQSDDSLAVHGAVLGPAVSVRQSNCHNQRQILKFGFL